jgi:hypothetical protein
LTGVQGRAIAAYSKAFLSGLRLEETVTVTLRRHPVQFTVNSRPHPGGEHTRSRIMHAIRDIAYSRLGTATLKLCESQWTH